MVDKKFFQPSVINGWIVVIYELQSRFNQQAAQELIAGLATAAREVGTL
jgi:eukaryotic translation initiation factor 2C